MELHIGLDDTDSPRSGCTTYLGYLIALKLKLRGVRFLDLPYLVRLNPNVPVKTRGNGAVSLHVDVEARDVDKVVEECESTVMSLSEKHGKTSPGLLVATRDALAELRPFYERALHEFIPRTFAERVLDKLVSEGKILSAAHKGRGIVGAAAAIGAFKMASFTYELLVYRTKSSVNKRELLPTLLELDKKYRPLLFSTYDYAERRLLAAPGGETPVVLGLRGLDPNLLLEAASLLEKKHGLREWIIYKTNQATQAHLRFKSIADIHPYDSVLVKGRVASRPRVLQGGHVKLRVCDSTGCIDTMFFWETGRLRKAAKLLREGDLIEVGGGVIPQRGLAVNAEVLRVIEVQPLEVICNPLCPRCGARMKSAGRGKGFKCSKCGYRSSSDRKNTAVKPRLLEPGVYLPSPRSYRHLTRPPDVLGIEALEAPLNAPWVSEPQERLDAR